MSAVARLTSRFATLFSTRMMPVALRPAADEPPAKRLKMESAAAPVAAPTSPTTSAASPLSKKQSKTQQKAAAKAAERAAGGSFRPRPDVPTAGELAEIAALQAAAPEFTRSYAHEVEYRGKMVLAPMVRSGSLPTRLLSLYYGAGLVWSPEIVDKAIIGATRSVDPETGVITYHKGQGPIFTCHPIEKPFLVFQIGSSDPELAVQAARVVARDVAAIDLNCGCPKPFSTHAGMGAALLSTPDLLLNIVRALVRAIPLPISAKIRLLPTRAATMRLAARILATGVRNLTVHCRTRDMRPGEKAIHERLGEVVALGRERGVSVTCNGDGEGWTNWEAVKAATGADSLMIARAAESNPSCFAPEVQDATTVVVPQLLSWAAHSGHNWGNTKFLLAQYKAAGPTLSKQQKKDAMAAVSRGKSVQEVAEGLAIVVPDRDMTVSAERGAQFMRDLEERLRARPEWAVWEAAKAQAEAEVDAMLAAAAVKAEEAPATAATEPAPPLTEEAPAPAVAVCAPEAPAKAE